MATCYEAALTRTSSENTGLCTPSRWVIIAAGIQTPGCGQGLLQDMPSRPADWTKLFGERLNYVVKIDLWGRLLAFFVKRYISRLDVQVREQFSGCKHLDISKMITGI